MQNSIFAEASCLCTSNEHTADVGQAMNSNELTFDLYLQVGLTVWA
jgi:hypothetical protein